MGQYWQIFCLSRETTGDWNIYSGIKLGELFSAKHARLVRNITVPVTNLLVSKWLKGYEEHNEQAQSKFLCLPKDILSIIFDQHLDQHASINLAITCKYLLAFFRARVEFCRNVDAAEWYQCRLAIVGDYAKYSDLPRHFLSDATRREMRVRFLAQFRNDEDEDGDGDDQEVRGRRSDIPFRLGGELKEDEWNADPCYNPPPGPRGGRSPTPAPRDWRPETFNFESTPLKRSPLDAEAYGGLELLCTRGGPLHRGVWANQEMLEGYSWKDKMRYLALGGHFYPSSSEWYLFNASKGFYVRARGIAELCGRPDDEQPFLPLCRIDFGHVLMMRAAWSTDPSAAMDTDSFKDFHIHRGQWAGDRFLISCDMEKLVRDFAHKFVWKDVTEEVIRDLKLVWKANFGRDWEADMKKAAPTMADDWFYYASDNPTGLGRMARLAEFPRRQFFSCRIERRRVVYDLF